MAKTVQSAEDEEQGTTGHSKYFLLHKDSWVQRHLVLCRSVLVPPNWAGSHSSDMIFTLSGFNFNLLALIQSIVEVKHHSRVCKASAADDEKES